MRDSEQFQDTAEDIHLYTAVTRSIKRGFYPLDDEEKNEFTIAELLFNESLLLPFRAMLKKEFEIRIPDAMNALGIDREQLGQSRILNYLRTWVEQNPNLSAQERGELLAGPLNNGEDALGDADNYRKWNRLILVILGIYRKKAVEPVMERVAADGNLVLVH